MMAEFNFDPTGQQKYIQGKVLSPQARAAAEYFAGNPGLADQFLARPEQVTNGFTNWQMGLVENPDFNPTEYRAGYGLSYDPKTGMVSQDLGLTPEQLQQEANYRANAVSALNQFAGQAVVTPELQAILDNMPGTLNEAQAAAFYNQMGFLPGQEQANNLAGYNWWKGRGTDFNDPVSGGQGYWSDKVATGLDKDPTGTQYQNMQAFIKANPGLFLEDFGQAADPLNIDQDLLQPFLQSALFDQGSQGTTATQGNPLLDLTQLGVNRVLPEYQNGVNQFAKDSAGYDNAAAVEAAGGVFDGRDAPVYGNANVPAGGKTYSGEGQTPTFSTQQAAQQQGLLGDFPTLNGVPQNYWAGNQFMMPPVDSTLGPHTIYKKGTFDTDTITPEQAAAITQPATTLPASIISGAVSQAAQNAINGNTTVQGGAQLTGPLFGGAQLTGPLFGGGDNPTGLFSGNFDPVANFNRSFTEGQQSTASRLFGDASGLGYAPGVQSTMGESVLEGIASKINPLLGLGLSGLNAYGHVKAGNDQLARADSLGDLNTDSNKMGFWAGVGDATGAYPVDTNITGRLGDASSMGTDPTFSGVPGGDHRMYNAETGKFEVMTPTPLSDPTGPAGYAAPVTPVQTQNLGALLSDYGWNSSIAEILGGLSASSPLFTGMSPSMAATYGYNSGPAGGSQSFFAGGI
jgi:hypothetical protein